MTFYDPTGKRIVASRARGRRRKRRDALWEDSRRHRGGVVLAAYKVVIGIVVLVVGCGSAQPSREQNEILAECAARRAIVASRPNTTEAEDVVELDRIRDECDERMELTE